MLTEVEELGPEVARGFRLFDRVFVPVDYTMESHQAVGVAIELLCAHGSAVCLFHAVENDTSMEWSAGIGSPAVDNDWIAGGRDSLAHFIENVAPAFADRIDRMAKIGSPMDTIKDAAREWGATLIVASVDAHARLFRSPAEQLVVDSTIGVLVIPRHPEPKSKRKR